MSLETLLRRLPSHFAKSPDSNNYKALSLVAKHIDDEEKLFSTIQKYWDVDQAEGIGLDRLGKDEGISRGSYDDEMYRKMIKIQYIINISNGEIESINAILTAYLEDAFLYIEEGWELHNEPASFFINVSSLKQDFPYPLLQAIKAAGVAAKVTLQQQDEMNIFAGGIVNGWNRAEIGHLQFEMNDLTENQHAIGYISTWKKHTIYPEVKHKWLITGEYY